MSSNQSEEHETATNNSFVDLSHKSKDKQKQIEDIENDSEQDTNCEDDIGSHEDYLDNQKKKSRIG